MVRVYYELIKGGYKTIDNVPSVWKTQVQSLLDADNTETTSQS